MRPKAITHQLVLQIFTEVLMLLLVLYKFYAMSLFIFTQTPLLIHFPSLAPQFYVTFFLKSFKANLCGPYIYGCLFSYWRVVKLSKAALLEKTLFPSAST